MADIWAPLASYKDSIRPKDGLDEAILAARDAVDAAPEDDNIVRAKRLEVLGSRLDDRYLEHGDDNDLEEAIAVGQKAIDLTPRDDPNRLAYLTNLSSRLDARHSSLGTLESLETSIRTKWQILDLLTDDDAVDYIDVLSSLSTHLGDKYSMTRATADLEESLRFERKVKELIPEDSVLKAGILFGCKGQLERTYPVLMIVEDLEYEIMFEREGLVHLDGDDRLESLDQLGYLLQERYLRLDNIKDLDEAIQIGLEVAKSTEKARTRVLDLLAFRFGLRYQRTEAMEDLEQAIRFGQEALDTTPEGHPDRAGVLDNLGVRFRDRYIRTGRIADAEESVLRSRQAVDEADATNPDWIGILSNLGRRLTDRYERTGAIADLNESIEIGRRITKAVSKEDRHRSLYFSILGRSLWHRCGRRDIMSSETTVADIEESIETYREAINCMAPGHPERPKLMNNLCNQLGLRFDMGFTDDLEEPIRIGREILRSTPADHPAMATYLNNLGDRLTKRWLRENNLDAESETIRVFDHYFNEVSIKPTPNQDLDEAIELGRQAANATAKDHPDYGTWLLNLGRRLGYRFASQRNMDDIEEAISYLLLVLNLPNIHTKKRLYAGIEAFEYCHLISDLQRAYQAAERTIGLMPKLIARSLESADKLYMLRGISKLATNAAATALALGKPASAALNMLEVGRGVLAASIEEIRTDIRDLQKKCPELADRFIALQDQFKQPVANTMPLVEGELERSWRPQESRHDGSDSDFDRLVAEIREQPGFEDFLLVPGEAQMRAAAKFGPVVVINAGYRFDAIIIEQHQISSLPLTRLTRAEVEHKSQNANLASTDILEWLWDAIACPILDALNITEPVSNCTDDWPHVWWIPTGVISKFPLHAAGRHRERTSQSVLDRTISSYSLSVKTLISSRQRSGPNSLESTASHAPQALLVAMQDTPGHFGRLDFAAKEIGVVYDICKSMSLLPLEPGRQQAHVESHLPNCKIFHFAGHGSTDAKDPLRSHLLLGEQSLEKLTVSALLDMNLHQRQPFLACLSACGTGRLKDERFLDEGIHLISAFQLAGFRHVVGTLWEVKDEVCVDVARKFYEVLRDRGGLTDQSVSLGLHEASRTLRDRWLRTLAKNNDERGDRSKQNTTTRHSDAPILNRPDQVVPDIPRDIVLCDDDEEDEGAGPRHWAPYVHFGA